MEYETFAFVYDAMMDTNLYKEWLDFTLRHCEDKKNLLELACGTGHLALALAQAGFQVTGLDLSEEMLSIASERFNEVYGEENNPICLTQGDMMDLSEVGNYDLVTCYSDSLCYMKNELEVQQVFDEVYRILDKGGIFIFDVHSLYKIDTLFPNFSFHDETEDYAFLWDSYTDEAPHSIVHELSFYVRNEDGTFTRHLEDHHERTYALEYYLRLLENAGFHHVEVYADFKDETPSPTSERWFFVCHKEDWSCELAD